MPWCGAFAWAFRERGFVGVVAVPGRRGSGALLEVEVVVPERHHSGMLLWGGKELEEMD